MSKQRFIKLPCLFCEKLTNFDPDDNTGPGRTCNECKKKHGISDE